MYIWEISLITLFAMVFIGYFLRSCADELIGNRRLSWVKYPQLLLQQVHEKNVLLSTLFVIEGIIGNLALIGLIVGVPLYFIFHI